MDIATAVGLAGTVANTIGSIYNTVTGISGSNNTSSSSTANYGNTSSATSAAGSTQSSGYTEQIGNSTGLANALISALTTPTGNNSNSAAAFNQQSADTANSLQQATWNSANTLNVASNLISNIWNAVESVSAKTYNAKQSEIEREWSEKMRATAYQDTVADMKAAGLNPVLAAKTGATGNYTGAEASSGMQNYSQTTSASVPSAHTANMSAMYDYGNNTSQFLQNACAAINSARQVGLSSAAESWAQSATESVKQSAKTIDRLNQSSDNWNFSNSDTTSDSTTKSVSGNAELNVGNGSTVKKRF